MKFTRQQENLVATFRGLPRANARARIKKTSAASELMDHLLIRHQLLSTRIESQLMPQWEYVVGQHNAHRCAPRKIERGVLHIVCAHPVMVREMTFSRKMILRRLATVCPTLRDVKFVTG